MPRRIVIAGLNLAFEKLVFICQFRTIIAFKAENANSKAIEYCETAYMLSLITLQTCGCNGNDVWIQSNLPSPCCPLCVLSSSPVLSLLSLAKRK